MKPDSLTYKLRTLILTGLLLWVHVLLRAQTPADPGNRSDAYAFLHRMWRGANFMASKIEGGYATGADFRLLAKDHFTHCRIGGKLYLYTGDAPDYEIIPERMENLGKAVDSCLHYGLVAIVDPLHTFNQEYTDADLPKLKKIWEQVATYFSGHPLDSVAFEIMNEPHNGVDLYNIVNESIQSIRSVPGNERRMVIVSGQGFSTRQALINAFNDNIFPAGDPCLIGTYHYYDPRDFTKQGSSGETVRWGESGNDDPAWRETEEKFDEVAAANTAWAQRHNTVPLPLYLGEFGVDNVSPPADLKRWLFWVRVQAEKRGYATAVWNMYSPDGSGKGIGPWGTSQKNDPSTRYLRQEPVEALMTLYEAEEGSLAGSAVTGDISKGYSGNGYVSFNGTEGAVTLNSVYCPKNGSYELYIRYQDPVAAGSSLSLKIFGSDGDLVLEDTLQGFVSTAPGVWNMIRFTENLPADTALEVVLGTTEGHSSGIAIDYLTLTKGEYYDNLFPSGEIISSAKEMPAFSAEKDLVYVYPTVFSDEIRITKEPGLAGKMIRYRLTNVLGKIFLKGILKSTDTVLPCSGLPSGTYLFFFRLKNASQTVRVIKT